MQLPVFGFHLRISTIRIRIGRVKTDASDTRFLGSGRNISSVYGWDEKDRQHGRKEQVRGRRFSWGA